MPTEPAQLSFQLGLRRTSRGQREIAILHSGTAVSGSLWAQLGGGSADAPGHVQPKPGTFLTTCPALVAEEKPDKPEAGVT